MYVNFMIFKIIRNIYRFKWSNISVYENEKIFYRSIVSFTDITKQRLYEAQLNYESTHDSLTGLYNRTYLDKASKSLKHKNLSPFSLIMVDIDDLKLINDNMGHMKGDNVIRNIADLLMQSFREDDIVVRFGGDEFLILLPNTDKKSMDIAVNRIQKNLKKLNEKDQDVNINLSIGCSTQYGELMIEELIKSADDSMYLVKKNKKNNSIIFSKNLSIYYINKVSRILEIFFEDDFIGKLFCFQTFH